MDSSPVIIFAERNNLVNIIFAGDLDKRERSFYRENGNSPMLFCRELEAG